MTPGFLGYRWLRRLLGNSANPTRGQLHQICLRVENLPLQRALFHKALGLPLLPPLKEKQVTFCLGDNLYLTLQEASLSEPNPSFPEIELTFEVTDLARVQSHLRLNGYNLERDAGGDLWYHPRSRIGVRLKPGSIPPASEGEGP